MNTSFKKNLKYGFGSPGETASKISEQYLYHIKIGKSEDVACSLILNNYINTFEMIGVDIDDDMKQFLRNNHQNDPALITYFLTMISAEPAGLTMQYKMHLDLILEVITEVHNEMLNENQTASELRISIEKAMGRNG